MVDLRSSGRIFAKGGRKGFPVKRGLHIDLNDSDLAYIAGLFDGEGGLVANRGHGNFFLSIYNTNKEALEFVLSKMKSGKIRERQNRSNLGKKPNFIYQIGGAYVVYDVLEALLPYLIIKKEKAKQAMRTIEKEYMLYQRPKSMQSIKAEIDKANDELVKTYGEFKE